MLREIQKTAEAAEVAYATRKKHICPKCGDSEFVTVAHVAQDWKVDGFGNFLEELETTEVVAAPDDGNIWTCARCGSEAIIV